MAERKMLVRKRRFLNQQPVVRLKRTTDDASLSNLKRHSHLFPINSSNDAVKCLKALISPVDGEPDLTLISLVLGALENALAEADAPDQDCEDHKSLNERTFPTIRFEAMKSLYHKFHQNLKTQAPSNSSIQNEDTSESQCSSKRAEVRLVADKVWIQLARSYRKDKLRMQYLYSLLTEHKLDSFGVTSCVVAACQLLDVKDVRMVMSEDHSWIEFGDADATESMEVTWHGKCNEDRRGSPIPAEGNKWIYSSDSPVRCSTGMTSALLASQLNPCIDGEVKSSRLLQIKRELMWFLHGEGLLKRLPMALIELAKLEAAPSSIPHHPKTPRVVGLVEEGDKCLDLLWEAVQVGKELYKNRLVYPYLELGEYFLRNNRGGEAFRSWADAADIISLYNYGKEDEEVYKRFYEVANEAFINLLKKSITEDASFHPDSEGKSVGAPDIAEPPLCRNPQGFADFLRFYDGMCCWEEDSQTPVLHVKWAQSMCTALLKFNTQVRTEEVVIKCDGEEDDGSDVGKPEEASDRSVSNPSAAEDRGVEVKQDKDKEAESKPRRIHHQKIECEKPSLEFVPEAICPKPLKACNTHKPGNVTKRKRGLIEVEEFGKEKHRNSVNNENCKYLPHSDDRSLNTFEELSREISRQLGISRRQTTRESENPMLEVLSKNCSNSIFNPEFFQGHCGEPFLKSPVKASMNPLLSDSKSTSQDQASHQRDPNKVDQRPVKNDPVANGRDSRSALAVKNGSDDEPMGALKLTSSIEVASDQKGHKKVAILLKSSKMKSLRDLLALERMNTQAIKLQLTAQSNTIFNKNKASSQRQSNERMPEKEHLDRHAAFSPSAPCPSEGEVKVSRRVLRNRAAK